MSILTTGTGRSRRNNKSTVDFKVSHADAELISDVLTQQILGQVQAAPMLAPVASSFTDRLSLIESLHQQGVLTDEEYSAKRSAILIEM